MKRSSLFIVEASNAFPFHSSTIEMVSSRLAFSLADFFDMISPAREPTFRRAGMAFFA
jgi:hypothetical protein